MEITRFISQLSTVATLTALSCIISLMYSQVIGPDENSNTAINDIIQMMVGVVHWFLMDKPTRTNIMAISPFMYSIIVLLPDTAKRPNPPRVLTKLTIPMSAVMVVGSMPTLAKMVLE